MIFLKDCIDRSRNHMRVPVSVVIPCYCCSKTIGRAFKSVVAQTMLPEEVLLVEDGSPDSGRTLESLYQLQQRDQGRFVVKVIPLSTNSGPSVARNTGWDAASQPYIAFLDADDSWHPRKLEIQYEWMRTHQEVVLCGHQSTLTEDGELPPSLPSKWEDGPVTPFRLSLSNLFPTRSVMLLRDLPYRFEPAKRHSEDYLLWLQILLSGHAASLIKLPLAYSYKAHYGAAGLTYSLWKMERGELDTYHRLYQQGLIPVLFLAGLYVISLAKFAQRLMSYYLSHRPPANRI